jgi:hypothetical protein
MKQDTKTRLLRFVLALMGGLVFGFVFIYLFANLAPRAFESMGEFIGRIFGLGFEGGPFELLIIVVGSVAVFSLISWWILGGWVPLRSRNEETR